MEERKTMSRVHRCDSVHIIALTRDNEILILREYRPFYGEYIWRIPSGRVDKENDAAEAAQRELREETSYKAKQLEHYCSAYCSESFDKQNHIFIARDLEQDPDPPPQDDDELIEVHILPLEDALEKILTSPVVDEPCAYALLRYAHEHPYSGVGRQ